MHNARLNPNALHAPLNPLRERHDIRLERTWHSHQQQSANVMSPINTLTATSSSGNNQ